MQLKKLLQGSAFALVAAACAIAVPTVVKAAGTGAFADAGIGEVKVDGINASMTVKGSDANVKEIQAGFGKTSKSGKISVSAWQSYENAASNGGVTIDLSKLNSTKDNYIVLTTPGAKEVSIVKIPANDKTIKAKFNAGKGMLQIASGDKAGTPADIDDATKGKDYEYRTTYGNWTALVSGSDASAKLADLTLYQNEGAKLVIRKKSNTPSTIVALAPSDQLSSESYSYGNSEVKSQVYVASKLPSKEAKVTIPAMAKGPSITADYVNGTIKFPKKSQYRILTTGTSGKYYNKTDASADGKTPAVPYDSPSEKTTPADIAKAADGTTPPTTFYLEVRTSKTEKKAASKWASIKVETPADLTATNSAGTGKTILGNVATDKDRTKFETTNSTGRKDATTGGLKDPATDALKGTGEGGLKWAKLVEAGADGTYGDTNILETQYVAAGTVKEKYYEANAVQFENRGKKTYEVVKGTAVPEATVRGTKINPGAKVTIKNVKDGDKFYIRIVGNKKAQTWTSAYAQLGVVDFPFTIPKTDS